MKFFSFFFVGLGLIIALGVWAKLEDVTYPVAELGSCESKEACFTYCNEPANRDACMTFAEANKLLEEEEIKEYRAVQEVLAQGGPGGCANEAECEMYCDDINHIRECIAFADENGLKNEEELEEAQKVLNALDAGYSVPGGCTSKESCDAYCSQPENMEECLNFAEAVGFMSQEEIEGARTVMALMQNGQSPGGCLNQSECDAYCGDEAHFEECLDFSVRAGFMSEEEATKIRATGGSGPGGCRSDEECKAYCDDATHKEECTTFAVQAGLMSEEDADMIKQMSTDEFAGPGGCSNEEECRSYCDDEANKEECLSFFGGKKDEGMKDFIGPGGCVSEEECTAYCQDETHAEECMPFSGDRKEGEENPLPLFDQERMEEGNKEFQGEYENFIEPGGCAEGTECTPFFYQPMDGQENNSGNNEYGNEGMNINEDMYGGDTFNGEQNQLDYPYVTQDNGGEPLLGNPVEWKENGDPNYQTPYEYEGIKGNELYNEPMQGEYGPWEEYKPNEFEVFDPGNSPINFQPGGDSAIPYEEIYVQPENISTPPSGDGGGVPQSEGGMQGGEGGGEPLGAADSGFIHTVKQLFGGILTKTRELMSI